MLSKLITYASELPADELAEVSLQDIAVCEAWFESFKGNGAQLKKWDSVPDIVEQWTHGVSPRDINTEGRRHQWVLRDLIDLVLGAGNEEVTRDEADFLCATFALTTRVDCPEIFERVNMLLAPHVDRLNAIRSALDPAEGLPALSKRLHPLTARDLIGARPREIRVIAGVDMPCRGPLTTLPGHVKVLGSVPENCTLVVESGCCSVEGYVMGRIAIKEHCEVRENIAGVVISRQGDIRARGIIDQAYVISKAGNVQVRRAESPRLIFAGNSIRIAENAVRGRYASPDIRIGKEARSGRFDASKRITAERFANPSGAGMTIVLRRGFSSEEYGETRPPEANRLVSKALRLRREIANLDSMARGCAQEADQCAQSALYYLCTGEDSRKHVEAIQSAKQRLARLDQVIAGLCSLSASAEEKLARPNPDDASPDAQSAEEGDTSFSPCTANEQLDDDLSDEFTEMRGVRDKLGTAQQSRKVTSSLLVRLRERLAGWTQEHQDLEAKIARNETELQKVANLTSVLEKTRGRRSHVDILRQILVTAKSRPKNDPLAKKIDTSFVTLMVRTVTKCQDRVRTYREHILKKRRNFQKCSDQLLREFQIVMTLETPDGKHGPTATGRFDAGTMLFTDPFAAEENTPPPGTSREIRDSGDEVKTYVRTLRGIVEDEE